MITAIDTNNDATGKELLSGEIVEDQFAMLTQ